MARKKYKPKGIRMDAVGWVLKGLQPFKTAFTQRSDGLKSWDEMSWYFLFLWGEL